MTTTIKMTKTTFKKLESEWYNYHHTLKEISKLREEIMNPYQEEEMNHEGGQSNLPGQPTERIATRLTTSKQLNYLNEIVDAVERVYNALPDNYKKVARLRYWNKNGKLKWEGIALETGMSERQARRWRNEIIQATGEVLGWR
ncbi:transcriptional regulator [Lentibacillus amyloliquefaciens]|nr:transcriptional regulator [Lentibacillus amyloliquefaciens]